MEAPDWGRFIMMGKKSRLISRVTEGFHIGSYRGGNGRFFNGLIDEVGVWDRVLNKSEIGYLAGGNRIP